MTARRPPVPSRILVGPFTYTVRLDHDETARASHVAGCTLDGSTDMQQLRICVDGDLDPMLQTETLLHEVLHTVTSMAGLRSELGDSRDERVVARLAPLLLDVLRRNPGLVCWLTRPLP